MGCFVTSAQKGISGVSCKIGQFKVSLMTASGERGCEQVRGLSNDNKWRKQSSLIRRILPERYWQRAPALRWSWMSLELMIRKEAFVIMLGTLNTNATGHSTTCCYRSITTEVTNIRKAPICASCDHQKYLGPGASSALSLGLIAKCDPSNPPRLLTLIVDQSTHKYSSGCYFDISNIWVQSIAKPLS